MTMPSHESYSDGVPVMAIKPFWRYAVTFDHHDGTPNEQPAMPFYTRRGAKTWARAMSKSEAMERCKLIVLRKAGWRQIDGQPITVFRGGEAE